ncbi:hypothetical protein AVEN_138843-1 [Araneus ventricosus]|uniref:Uncharacterized protein n=1 Tax=Araneus ventricosus TaxID=182803 RepID=A0A4Y2G888_ARAVE|nr:hypothetical protein AVEN_138843-1 [Araneus ventricosus]
MVEADIPKTNFEAQERIKKHLVTNLQDSRRKPEDALQLRDRNQNPTAVEILLFTHQRKELNLDQTANLLPSILDPTVITRAKEEIL